MSWATSSICPRKGHLAHHLEGSHVKGIGGPGAPHVFRLERLSDTGTTLLLCFMLLCVWMSCTWKTVLCSIDMDVWYLGMFQILYLSNVVWHSSSKILILSHVPTRRTFLQRLAHQVLATQGSPTKPVWLCLEDYRLKFTAWVHMDHGSYYSDTYLICFATWPILSYFAAEAAQFAFQAAASTQIFTQVKPGPNDSWAILNTKAQSFGSCQPRKRWMWLKHPLHQARSRSLMNFQLQDQSCFFLGVLPVYIQDTVHTDSDENKTLRKYANTLRRNPRTIIFLELCFWFAFSFTKLSV